MLKNPLMAKLRAEISPEDEMLIDESFALADRIHFLLEKHGITSIHISNAVKSIRSQTR